MIPNKIKGRDIINFIARHDLYDKDIHIVIDVDEIYKVSKLQPTIDVTGSVNGIKETHTEQALKISLQRGIKDIKNIPI